MKRIVIAFAVVILIATFFPSSAMAGSGPAKLDCIGKEAQGAGLRIRGVVPATEEDLNLVAEQGNRRSTLAYDDARIVSVDAFDDKVYVLAITNDRTHEETTLHAIPSTMRIKELQNGIQAEFDAKVTTPMPGLDHPTSGYDDYLHDAVVRCRYRYEI